MLFNSVDFLIFFPVVCLVYFLMPRRAKNLWLLAASYYFYMAWNPKYALLILASTAVTYLGGLLIGWAGGLEDKRRGGRLKKLFLGLSFGVNLGILAVFKYLGFFLSTLERVLSTVGVAFRAPALDILLPVGISFYTFQALSYTADVYRGELRPRKNFLTYALYVSFFPQLVAGPIERSGHLLEQLEADRPFDYLAARSGLLRMLWGLFQKVVIADRLAIFVDAVYAAPASAPGAAVALATVFFTVQIYCDFAGYSNIAIGAARVLGVELTENFRQPYLAVSIRDFWRRWHISLSSWFRDYLYIPLGGSRKGRGRRMLNILIVFLASGLWHGAQWHFVLWGLLHGVYQCVGDLTEGPRRRLRELLRIREKGLAHRTAATAVTFVLVTLAFAVFRAGSVSDAALILRSILTGLRPAALSGGVLYTFGLDALDLAAAGGSVALLAGVDVVKELRPGQNLVERQCLPVRWAVYLILIFAILVLGVYGPGYDASSFIYFAF